MRGDPEMREVFLTSWHHTKQGVCPAAYALLVTEWEYVFDPAIRSNDVLNNGIFVITKYY